MSLDVSLILSSRVLLYSVRSFVGLSIVKFRSSLMQGLVRSLGAVFGIGRVSRKSLFIEEWALIVPLQEGRLSEVQSP